MKAKQKLAVKVGAVGMVVATILVASSISVMKTETVS